MLPCMTPAQTNKKITVAMKILSRWLCQAILKSASNNCNILYTQSK